MTSIRTSALAGLTMIASMGAAAAYPVAPVSAAQFSALYRAGTPFDTVNQVAHYGHSGSIGRLNYGASPFHPEGPGNFSD